ncbi:MAG: NEW3 domain-containing protein [Chloroflexi bacterium]|nr:NEW3 domain-containing protein [Chloroflexota bacterium]
MSLRRSRLLRRILFSFGLITISLFAVSPVLAQSATPPPPSSLTLTTPFPGQVIGIGQTITLTLNLEAPTAQLVKLQTQQVPQGWNVTFQGNGNQVSQAYLSADTPTSVSLSVVPPTNVAAGDYTFTVVAQGTGQTAQLPISLTVKTKLPPKLVLTSDLPTITGGPTTDFSYSVTLQNTGDENVNVTMASNAPSDFNVTFTLSGQQVTSFPVTANNSASLTVDAKPVGTVAAGNYPFKITASGGGSTATLDLTATVTGQPSLTVTTSSGNLAASANSGASTPITVVVQNNGSATASAIQMSSSAPTGWNVSFNPTSIPDIPAGQQITVTMNVTPPSQAVAGDYMITTTATPTSGSAASADFRITVTTSTLWGVVGVVLVAVAIGVVALAVVRFGRR